ncbi:hypothetical protein F8388_018262 [Cannabis sativa]|uniref:Uncharacterized protein n=1 Tax=Cannabis sativa TaxID=3483 RepID=A0A7J6EIY3_CANSA|nr:hypothetical protein F8388_018262 [Cannabis sativa]
MVSIVPDFGQEANIISSSLASNCEINSYRKEMHRERKQRKRCMVVKTDHNSWKLQRYIKNLAMKSSDVMIIERD